ncbi:twist-related protein-like protein [Dinothrombium tinctorium]|uniref:Twist-related protein-like protein n=1 Tax=Dinothrombium tinctorium TaxID=1965070 RepID=A0A3S3PQS5_9ACAR|nr:twist-related protein-like protein [Dinothrombium tinctorium]RWS14639.1 twist-related protein-like protein [Dinothrombium tinctorium]
MDVNLNEKKSTRSTDKVDKMETLVEMPNEDEEASGAKSASEKSAGNANDSIDTIEEVKIPALNKYNLRTKSIQNRIETEKKRRNPRKEPKPKQRPPPLSKYRRKTANARERNRMQEINEAFEELKRVVPQFPPNKGPVCEKLTKITTLRLAVNYIAALSQILKQTDSENNDNLKVDNSKDRNNNDNNNSSGVNCNATNVNSVTTNATNNISNNTASNPINNNVNCDPLFDCSPLLTADSVVEIENLLKMHHRSSSGSLSDLPSCSSPSTSTETESLNSLESLRSSCGWDFSADESLDVPDTFDLILESDESMQLSDDPLVM